MATTQDRNTVADIDVLSGYRDAYKTLFRVAMGLVLVTVVLAGAVFYRVSMVIPQDRYFATTASGQRMQLVGLSEPYINNALLLDWAAQAATEILTFGFNDVNERFAISRKYFAPEGWESFRTTFVESSIFKSSQRLQQVITAIPTAPPVILGQGLHLGKWGWMVEVPIVMTIRAPGVEKMQRASVRMFVVRLPTSVNPAGIGIFTFQV